MIRRIRMSQNISLTDLAKTIGITPGGLCQIEKHLINPSLMTLQKLSKALNVSISDLIDSDFSTPPFDHNDVPDVCPYEDDYEPSDCEKCKYKDRCPFKYSEAEDE